MIAVLTGVLVDKSAAGVIVEAAGVGYFAHMTAPDIASMPAVGANVRVFTYMHVKDDAITLYGFESQVKKDLFVKLIAVSNVGPKAALAVLSHMSPDQLVQAILSEDIGAISGAPGIGRKTAQRLILELNEKLETEQPTSDLPGEAGALGEAREALIGLGYQPLEAAKALSGAEPGMNADWYVKYALRRLAKV